MTTTYHRLGGRSPIFTRRLQGRLEDITLMYYFFLPVDSTLDIVCYIRNKHKYLTISVALGQHWQIRSYLPQQVEFKICQVIAGRAQQIGFVES